MSSIYRYVNKYNLPLIVLLHANCYTPFHGAHERVTSGGAVWLVVRVVFVVAINTCNTLQWRRVRDTNSCERLLNKYKSVSDKSLGTLRGVKAQLILEDGAQPKFCRARNVPYAVKPYFEKELERLQEEGILSPIEYSPWASGVVPVAKRDTKDVRLCGDYKVTINPVIREDKFPLPRVEDIFAKMAGGKRFSKIDLKNAYLQIEVEETSKQYLTINTHTGLFQYNRLPFGIKTAPSIWQRAMEQTL